MSYVRANTGNPLGMRSSALGSYIRSSFPLPTTGMSRPIRTRLGLAWDNGPYPIYAQPENSRTRASAGFSGEYVPPGPPPRATQPQGVVTYRIDPATGKYRFYNTDILPRGIWQQNTFQHPGKPSLSSLGVPMQNRADQLVQLPNGRVIMMKAAPHFRPLLSGPGCRCNGRCKGLGADVCASDSDCGSNAMCVAGTCYSFDDPSSPVKDPIGTDINAKPAPSILTTPAGPTYVSPAGQIINAAGNVIAQVAPQQVQPVQQASSPFAWFSGNSRIGGTSVPNVLIAGGALALISAFTAGGRRK